MGHGRIDAMATRAIVPLRAAFLVLLAVFALVVWRSGELTARTAEAEARRDAYGALAIESRDALLARLYQGLVPFEDGERDLLERAGRIDEAARRALALAGPDEREALAEIGSIAAELRRLTDAAAPGERLDLYASGEGRALALRFIALADGLASRAEAALDLQIDARGRQRALVVPTFLAMLAVIAALIAASVRRGALDVRRMESARLVPRIEAERDRADLLAQEMRHRVKNLFAVVSSIVGASARERGTPAEIAALTRGRVEALARAHTLSDGGDDLEEFAVIDALRAVALPYAPAPERIEVGGDAARVPASAATPLGLVVNELATNAVKYGAWSGPGGTVSAIVAERPGLIEIAWRERGGPAPAEAALGEAGFGSAMIDMSVAQLGGTISRQPRPSGMEVIVTIPDGAGAARAG